MGAAVDAAPEETSGDFEVMPANWDSIRAWLACETQWRAVVGLAGLVWLGLDYAGVDVVLRRLQLDDRFGDLQLMEGAALRAFGEAR